MLQRMLGAATFKVATFEEVKRDRAATTQAMLVVVFVALATGIGLVTSKEVWGTVVAVITALVGWALLTLITYYIGTTMFPTGATPVSWDELARTLGFAQSPGVLRVMGIISPIASSVLYVTLIWQLSATIVAVRQALGHRSTWQATRVVVVAYMPYIILMAVITFFLTEA